MGLFEELQWRGMIHSATEGTQEVLNKEKLVAYIGFDPSAPSLHVGSLLPVMGLVHLQRYGHTPIVLVGGGTGLIGDPSGKSHERPLMTKQQIEENAYALKQQLCKWLDFECKTNPAVMLDNSQWLSPLNLMDFLRDIGKHFTVNYMLAKESVQRRIQQAEGISFTEFSYMLLQAYDFLVLYDRFNCRLQMGGSDQWGNITAGIDLIRKLRGATTYGLVFPLITTTAGTKFGKTEAGAIWIDPKLTLPFHFYQFWFNTDDRDVITYLKYFTLLPKEEIQNLEDLTLSKPERREAQRKLARELTRMIHGEENLRKVEKASRILFDMDMSEVTPEDMESILQDSPSVVIKRTDFEGKGMPLVNMVVVSGLAPSKSEAKRLIQSGGIYLNDRRITDVQYVVPVEQSIFGRFFILHRGSREYRILYFT